MKCPPSLFSRKAPAFTLIELLTVIAIIGILMALLFPAIGSAMDNAKKTQAKNDIMQTITAVKGFYTEYSRYPNISTAASGKDTVVSNDATNKELFDILRNKEPSSSPTKENTRGIVYFEGKQVKPDASGNFKGGFGDTTSASGAMHDPWGKAYLFIVDANYDNSVDVSEMGSGITGPAGNTISTGVAGFSLGKTGTVDGSSGKKDDVYSW